MKSIVFIMLASLALATAQTYQLVWADEFNGNSLDTSKWQYEVNCLGGGNAELQCYTSSASNVAVRNGSLVITALNQDIGQGKQYTSGRVNTKASVAWKYGRFDIRAKTPNGIYLWPALWMMPRDSVYGSWAASGEIDIMETRGQTLDRDESTLHHGGRYPNNVYTGSGPQPTGFDMSADYHVYSAIWTPDLIQFLIDGKVYTQQQLNRPFWSGRGDNPYTANNQPFDQYFYFIINLAVGGGFFGGEANSLTSALAARWSNPSLYVDYVRAYQLSTNNVNSPVVPVAASAAPASSTASASPAAAQSASTSCPTGYCGASSCCADQNNGFQCYSASSYGCPTDSFNGKSSLCQSGFSVCKGACFNPQQYSCVNGGLQWGASPAAAPAKTSSSSSSSSTSAATSAAAAAAPVNNASACPNGCGSGSCCNDARMGGVCYDTKSYTCASDYQGNHLCAAGSGSCNGSCYNASQYKCVNNQLSSL